MIVVNGTQYKTLDQKLYADGKRVTEAYVNGTKVYPERGDGYVVKLVGSASYVTTHTSSGHRDTSSAWRCRPRSNYNFSCSFSIVFRCSGEVSPYAWDLTLPALTSENISRANASSTTDMAYGMMDMFTTMWPPEWYPHPVYDQPELYGISVLGITRVKSTELLFNIQTSDIPQNPMVTEDSEGALPDGWHESLYDVTATPEVSSYPGVSGSYHIIKDGLSSDNVPIYTTDSFRVHLRRVDTGMFRNRGLTCLFFDKQFPEEIKYNLVGHRLGSSVEEEAVKTFHPRGYYTLGMAPYTEIVYVGSEREAPEEMLHPVEGDL